MAPVPQVLYVEGDNKLYVSGGAQGEGTLLGEFKQFGARITSPTWGPDGERIAFWASGKKVGFVTLPSLLGGKDATLVMFDCESRTATALGTFKEPLKPCWASDGRSLLVADAEGLHLVYDSGAPRILIKMDGIREVTRSPDGRRIAYVTGEGLFLTDTAGRAPINVYGRSKSLGLFPGAPLRALAFSPDGERLVFADGPTLSVASLDRMSIAPLHEAKLVVYWTAWLPDGNQLMCLSGRPNRETSLLGITPGQTGTIRGWFYLFSVSDAGDSVVEVYHQIEMDVREVHPDLSPDGRLVTFISSRQSQKNKVFVAATDGSGWEQLTRKGRCSSPSWRPNPREGVTPPHP